ncbi:MAG: DNA adenine methylase [Bacilli bacterium]
MNNKEELLKIYDEYSSESLKMSGENLTDKYRWYIKKFVSTHEEELNGMMSNSFNKKIENFVQEIVKSWLSKMKRLCKIEEKSNKLSNDDILDNIESSFKTAYYNHFRYLYNHYEECGISQEFMIAIFYFIRENCYASMFRYNSDGYFNVPYGGVSYNKKDLSQKILRLSSEELILALENVEIYNDDFQLFCEKLDLKKGDFIFIDPPYDTEFSTYAKNKFDQEDQIRLFEFAKNTEANVMIIIKKTDFIENLYRQSKKFNFDQFSKKYLVSFRDRNTRSVTHLVITNY